MASRTPPKEAEQRSSETNNSAKGAFWSTQYAQAAKADEPVSRQEKSGNNKASSLPVKTTSPPRVNNRYLNSSPPKNGSSPPGKSSTIGTSSAWQSDEQHEQSSRQSSGWQNEDEPGRSSSTSRQKQTVPEPVVPTTDSFAAFEAEYSQSVLQSRSLDQLKDEVVRLNEALRQALSEKAAIASKFEKLTTICRSQRQELQDLKSHLHSRTSNSIPQQQQQQQQNSASRARASQSFDQASSNFAHTHHVCF